MMWYCTREGRPNININMFLLQFSCAPQRKRAAYRPARIGSKAVVNPSGSLSFSLSLGAVAGNWVRFKGCSRHPVVEPPSVIRVPVMLQVAVDRVRYHTSVKMLYKYLWSLESLSLGTVSKGRTAVSIAGRCDKLQSRADLTNKASTRCGMLLYGV